MFPGFQLSHMNREVLDAKVTKWRLIIMLNEAFRVLKYSSVIFSAQYAVYLVTNAIMKHQRTKRDMSVVDKLNKKREEEEQR